MQAEAKASPAAKDPDFGALVSDAHFDARELDPFRVADDGVTFFHDYQFPHVALALQPAGEYFLPWRELVGDVAAGGPLARILSAP